MAAFPHVADRIFGRPVAIDPASAAVLMQSPVIRRILSDDVQTDDRAGKEARAKRRSMLAALSGDVVRVSEFLEYGVTAEGIAIIEVNGLLSQKFDFLAALCGFTTYDGLTEIVNAALANYRVQGMLLNVDSPGGEAAGMIDVGDMLLAAGNLKPIYAVANHLAASAAYAIAGSAERLFVPRVGTIGSIGAMAIHVDTSAEDAMAGEKYTAIFSGARKVDGWSHAPLAPEARAQIQANVDTVRNHFVALVGRQGRMSAEAALATEAATYMDQAAVDAGLADTVGTFDDALAQLTKAATGQPLRLSPAAAAAVTQRQTRSQTMTQPNGNAAAATAEPKVDPAPAPAAPAAVAPAPAAPAAVAPVAPAAPAAAVAAVAPVAPAAESYTLAMATEVAQLCEMAGFPGLTATFQKNQVPVAKVREALLAKKAAKGDDNRVDAAPAGGDGSVSSQFSWDKAYDKTNKDMGLTQTARVGS